MADEHTVPRNITFHDDASEEFRSAILDAYAAVPAAIRHRLDSFAGAQTLIRTVRRAPVSGTWIGLSVPPSSQSVSPRFTPIEDRALTRLGRPRLMLAEYDGPFQPPVPRPFIVEALHHEIGHRIDAAISGDNFIQQVPDQWPNHPTQRLSASALFIEAFRQDLLDAGWRPPGDPPPPGLRVMPRLLPVLRDPNPDHLAWRMAASELFAEIYAHRFSSSLDDQSFRPEAQRTDFSIFRRTGRLVDRAVATFAGEPVVPLNPNRGDYRPGERARPFTRPSPIETSAAEARAARRISRRLPVFRPVGPDAPHPLAPRPR
jgi:hypothetical protein